MLLTALGLTCTTTTVHASKAKGFSTDVIGINESHLSSRYWLNKVDVDQKLLMTSAQISQFNKQLIGDNPHINSPLSMPNFLTDVELLDKVNRISTPSTYPRYYAGGEQLSTLNYAEYIASTNQNKVKKNNEVLFALVVNRTGLRRFPTLDKVYKESTKTSLSASPIITLEQDLDMFQETALFPGNVVAILHTSSDEQWYLAQAYNYLAWLPKKDVAIGNKEVIASYKKEEHFLVITGSQVHTNYLPDYIENHEQLSRVKLDMGIRLPLAQRSEYEHDVHGQNPYSSHIVKLPIKDKKGKLQFSLAAIARSQDVHVGYLPYNKHNVIQQSFKFLGERYGWGHDYNGRDCTGFIDEIYKSFGFIMPRNSGQQAKSTYGVNHFFTKETTSAEKLAVIDEMQSGDLIYIPGHVMMYLGKDNGQPYIIHDVKDLSYQNKNGDLYYGTLNGVSVTPLLPLKDYINNITNIKRMNHNRNVNQRNNTNQGSKISL